MPTCEAEWHGLLTEIEYADEGPEVDEIRMFLAVTDSNNFTRMARLPQAAVDAIVDAADLFDWAFNHALDDQEARKEDGWKVER